jgi:hypothetical protein
MEKFTESLRGIVKQMREKIKAGTTPDQLSYLVDEVAAVVGDMEKSGPKSEVTTGPEITGKPEGEVGSENLSSEKPVTNIPPAEDKKADKASDEKKSNK